MAGDAHDPLRLTVHAALAPVETLWTAFQEHAHATFYQTFLWCRAWCETVGKTEAVEIRIVTATDAHGGTVFILPLQVRRRSGIRVIEWLGTPHNSYGHGLFAQAFLPQSRDWFAAHWAEIVRLAGPADAVCLADMPHSLDGVPHPLQQLFNVAGANRSYRMALSPDYPGLLARKRSGESRRHTRRKEAALAALGDVWFGLPVGKDALHATLTLMFEQQEKRLAEFGIHGTFGPIERSFLHRLADLQDDAHPMLLPYALKFRGEILAVMLGGLHANTYWALISSLTGSQLRDYSPGDLAMHRTIEAGCNSGLAQLDFAAGDTGYKLHWADEVIPLQTLLTAINLRGLAWASLMGLRMAVKRRVKQSPATRHLAMALRKMVLGTRSRRSRPEG